MNLIDEGQERLGVGNDVLPSSDPLSYTMYTHTYTDLTRRRYVLK